ncbi:MAG: hypothetical protein HRT88_14805 [Lentisphaeraceae bacterium]|nr:hypothetical protein [Lentisphaeraceae bacterium]
MNESRIRKFFVLLVMLMSATLLYGGYQVRSVVDEKSSYEDVVRNKAIVVSSSICREMGDSKTVVEDPMSFLRLCSEEL